MGRKIIVASKSIQLYKPEKHDMVLHSQKIGKISMQYKQNAFGRKTLLKLWYYFSYEKIKLKII